MRRVAVTGLGAMTPLGNDWRSTWDAAVAGRSGIDFISAFDASEYPVRIAAEVKDFDPAAIVGPKEARRLDRYALLSLAAAVESWADAGLEGVYEPGRVGVLFGSAIGGIIGIVEQHNDPARARPRAGLAVLHPQRAARQRERSDRAHVRAARRELRARLRVRDGLDGDRGGGGGDPAGRRGRGSRRRLGGRRDAADPRRLLRDAWARRRGGVPAACLPAVRRDPRRVRDRRGRVRARARGDGGRPRARSAHLRRGARLRRLERCLPSRRSRIPRPSGSRR